MEAYGVVYLLVNTVNGKMYVGQTTQSLKKRMRNHINGKLCVDNAIRKHKPKNFRCEILKRCATKAELDAWERFFIAALKTKSPLGYNRTDGGDGSYTRTDETLKKLSDVKRGQHHTAETCAKISFTSTGVPKSPEHCEAISAGLKGKFIGDKNHRFGKHHTQTARYTISIKQRADSPFKNLLAELDARQMSYAALAKLLGYASISNISDKMRCRKNFTERDKVRLVEIFKREIEYLLARDETTIVAKAPAPKRYSPYKNLVAELDARQMSYTALAKLLDLSQSAVSFKMLGERNFTERDKVKLVEIFKREIEYLLARDDG